MRQVGQDSQKTDEAVVAMSNNVTTLSRETAERESDQSPATPAKLVRQPPVRIDTILTKEEFVPLARHMLNGNPVSHFLTIWRDVEGESRFAKAKPSKNDLTHAGCSYDTVKDKSTVKTALGFYPKNQDNKSTFAALDFDAHSGNDELAKGRAIRAFSWLLEYRGRCLILSGS